MPPRTVTLLWDAFTQAVKPDDGGMPSSGVTGKFSKTTSQPFAALPSFGQAPTSAVHRGRRIQCQQEDSDDRS
jgi:hypothetical protein